MRAHCLCENKNACARCGQWLYERKLDANYYSEEDGKIWQIPSFPALNHRCEGVAKIACRSRLHSNLRTKCG
jgi:hypothetical protein